VDTNSKCYTYALRELKRLLEQLGFCVATTGDLQSTFPALIIENGLLPEKLADEIGETDGYSIHVTNSGISISGALPKGVLNGVYDLAEQLGYLFLMPGNAGEWAPETIKDLSCGNVVKIPRFPFRGVFWEKRCEDYTVEEWLRFYAKLKFNALAYDDFNCLELTEELGLRFEIGGHGLSKLLPRTLFDTDPAMFRMFQPEDFRGKRTNDSNFCVNNPSSRKVVKDNFRQKLREAAGCHALHAWADDLPAGGWCLCPSCRAFTPEDQAMLSMRILAETACEELSNIRIPFLAYHDTLFPGNQIDAPDECFLLYAPRERCYAHALDDADCKRNRWYLDALKQWMKKFKNTDDAHVFEYYFDQILFRGMYPFLPETIINDTAVYLKNGIECFLSLQVAGPTLAPEYNMLVFSQVNWDEHLTADRFISKIADKLSSVFAGAWKQFLKARAEVFSNVMQFCEHDTEIYLDYRWLPETTNPFGKKMTQVYRENSILLHNAAANLAAEINTGWPERLRQLAEKEIKRANFEAEELKVMACQQAALNHFAAFLNGGTADDIQRGIELLIEAIAGFKLVADKAMEFGLTEDAWYLKNINKWLSGEFERKIANYRGFLE